MIPTATRACRPCLEGIACNLQKPAGPVLSCMCWDGGKGLPQGLRLWPGGSPLAGAYKDVRHVVTASYMHFNHISMRCSDRQSLGRPPE